MAILRISKEKRALALMALSEGTAVNSVARMAGVSKPALLAWFMECGEACAQWHDRNFRNLSGVKFLQIDEQWSFVFKHKEKMTPEEKLSHPERGDSWYWAALDPESKAIIAWRTARRSHEACMEFCRDLAARVPGEVQVTSDALYAYRQCIRAAFGSRVHYATEKKEFYHDWSPDPGYLKKRIDPLKAVHRKRILGKPDMDKATVCHVERYFLTVRQSNKRTARKTLAYSKKWDNHAATASLHAFLYNMTRRHTSLDGKTPAQALGITDKRWTAEMVVAMVDAYRREKEEREFEAAFNAPRFAVPPKARRVHEPQKPLVPWYLDKDSGGPNPPQNERKPGIQYADAARKPLRWVEPVKLDVEPEVKPEPADWSGVPESWINDAQRKRGAD